MLNHHDHGMPIVARLHEVRAAAGLAAEEGLATHEGTAGTQEAVAERVLPFVGDVVRHEPGVAVSIERRLSLDEDLFLADHHFVQADGVKPLSACFPVVPMTVSLEIMAEAAACLAPGYGLIGFEQVSAARWIALADTDSLALRIEARVRSLDVAREIRRIDAEIYVHGEIRPSISATVLFSSHYQLDLNLGFGVLNAPRSLSAGHVYEERQLFHGPRFQCLTGEMLVGERGVQADLRVNSPANLLRSTEQPQLLIDPALLDAVGQAMAVWTLQQGGIVFPIGLGKLELYRATPAPGTRVPMRIEITSGAGKTLAADVEIEDGQGGVWLRVKDWRSWRFQWDRKLVAFRRQPEKHLLSDELVLPPGAVDADATGRRVTKACLVGFDLELLARHYLNADEMRVFASHAQPGQQAGRQRAWLLGRIAAKDALRAWHAREHGLEAALHPAAFGVANDARGKPVVTGWPEPNAPSLTIAHSGDEAVAIVQRAPVGVDIERIESRDEPFLRAIAGDAERALLDDLVRTDALTPAQRDAWVTRLWCAKEALGKWLGTGVEGAPHQFEATALESGGHLHMRHRGSGREAQVSTLQDGAMIVAVCRECGREKSGS
ncbi:polyketide synthase dehydratase domain-containing protein [Paraburkholderia sp. J67]|uniref:polyketide synthase dehydratase domain-containing protein n=1 Tax=Paraburkholderia sp. J67 TaxID=2805435 RepID=UPI002ABDACE7|nr:polyketide synthase dehydratase domain-containing protein [Paraburkholderia sp. J67]